ncbi:MAG TPA: hypothetical protein DCM32_00885 [Xanthomonadaceae bacterium]|nr:hypothetical protein [Xanthomonadaceae bacterium]
MPDRRLSGPARLTPAMRLLVLLLAVSAALLAAAPAQALSESRRFGDFAIDNWTVADGLPQAAVQALGQDGDGYVWVGTQSAVARFDGVRFETFDRERTGGLETAMADGGFQSADGHVWFSTRDGALRLRRDEVRRFASAGMPVRVQAITEWPAGRMLFGTPQGVYELAGEALVPTALGSIDASALLGDGATLWVGTRGRLLRIAGGQTRSIALEGGDDAAPTALQRRGATLWIATTRGLWRLDGEGPARRFDGGGELLATQPVEALCVDGGGSLWAGTATRLFRLRSDDGVEAPSDEAFVRNPWINACFSDREGNLWLGSNTESLFRVWDGLVSRLTPQDGLHEPFVWSLEADARGGVLLGTNRGLARWRDGRFDLLVPPEALPDAAVYELARLPGDRLWLGTRGGLRERVGNGVRVPPGAEALEGAQINAIVVDSDEGAWVGSSAGLFRQHPGGPIAAVAAGTLAGAAARVRAVLPLGGDRALLGTEGGIYEVAGDTVSAPAWAQPLAGRMITALLPLPDGRLVVATLDSGLAVAADERAVLLGSEALPTLNAWHLVLIDGALFVTSTEGVYRIAVDTLPDPRLPDASTRPDTDWVISMAGRNQSGQRARCCNGGARSRALLRGDELWLPSISGVLRLDLDAIGRDPIEPLVHVEAVWHDDRRLPREGGAVRIDDHHDRDLRIDYTALSFRNPRALRFEYRLDGFDADWVDAGERRSAFYTNLPAGEYRFRVRARDAYGRSVEAAEALPLVMVPHWSEQPAVKPLAVLGVALLAGGLGWLAMLGQRRRAAELEALVDERTRQLQQAKDRLEQANAVLAAESQTDALTGLPNRRAVFQQMPSMLARHPDGLVLALVDIDHFKRVNDTYGHAAGDQVLRDFAAFLRRSLREGDLLARWGGEEFLLVLGGLADEAVPARMQRLLEDGRAQYFELGREHPLHITFSIGWTRHPLVPGAQGAWIDVLELADAALYQAKAHGRDTWVGLAAGPRADAPGDSGHPGRRIAERVHEGRLQWLNLRPRLAGVPRSGRAG